MVVLLQLLALRRLGTLRFTLLYVRLQLGNLLVDVRDILFDDIGEFLWTPSTTLVGERTSQEHTLISTGLSSNKVFRLATVNWMLSAGIDAIRHADSRCASLPSFTVVLLMSLPIEEAIRVNSDLLPSTFVCSSRCFCSAPFEEKVDLFRMDSTHARNSLVRSWTGILIGNKDRGYAGAKARVTSDKRVWRGSAD